MTANDKTLQNGGSDKSTLATPANVKENIALCGRTVATPMPIWVIFALVWPCAPHSGLSVTILAHSDGIHSNSVTQSGSRWPREYRVSASGIRR